MYSHAIGAGACVQAGLHQLVVLVKVCGVEFVGHEIVVDERLPCRRQTEDVEAVGVGEVLHLTLRHVRRWTTVLLLEVIGSEVALSSCQHRSRMVQSLIVSVPLTLVSMPISQPAMFTPASQTAFACATRADTRIERSMLSVVQRERVSQKAIGCADDGEDH